MGSRRKKLSLFGALGMLCLPFAGCSSILELDRFQFSDDCAAGTEQCRCDDGACEPGLECREPGVCVGTADAGR